MVDGRRLTQAWLQLVANAVKFSVPGSTVSIGSAVVGQTLHVWVRDAGIGISPLDLPTIFERFGRGKTDRSGSGLGLAIVSAIAAGHGGSVAAQSELGAGAKFTMELPCVPREVERDKNPPQERPS